MLRLRIIAGSLLAAIVVIYGIAGITTVVPGEVGIVVKNLGSPKGMQDYTLGVGMHWLDPFVFDVITYDTRIHQQIMEDTPANTEDGQPISIDVSFDVGLVANMIPGLHQKVGHDFYNQIVYPAARASIRQFAASEMSDAVYTGAGRARIQAAITQELQGKLGPFGISIVANLRDIRFQNQDFVNTLERKAQAQQEVTIQQRQAEAAAQAAVKVQNVAQGQRFKVEQEAQAQREKLRLEGEGEQLRDEARAKGNLAIATAEAQGTKLRREALTGSGSQALVAIEWARNLGPNVKIYGVPTGAPGTSTFVFDEALRNNVAQAAAAVASGTADAKVARR